MLYFVRNTHLIIGDRVPVDDEHSQIVIMIKKIIDSVTAKNIHKDSIPYFKVLIH